MKEVVKKLDPRERTILNVLKDNKTVEEIEAASKLKEVEVIRSLQFLENKGVLKINTEEKEIIRLGKNGLMYFKDGMPERRFLDALKGNELGIGDVKKNGRLNDEEFKISVGILKGKAALDIVKGKDLKFKLNDNGKKLLDKGTFEEKLVHELGKEIKEVKLLDDTEKHALINLKKRKDIVKQDAVKVRSVELTKLGESLIKEKLDINLIESLTPEIIRKGSWKNKEFREYDIKINVPKINYGKRHFVNQAIDYARRIWMDMGFKEMKGPIIQSSFWNFDALFVPQDHPARELQDTYFLDNKGKLPGKELINKVKKAHESGIGGSKGWGYKWSEEEAKRLVLRTHTTVLSAQTIAYLRKEDLPVKYFAIGRNYRNETLDPTHLFEFNQTEGIVVDENANFRHLLGYLKEFFKKMGFEKARFRPAFFPYTEPSVEIDVYHPMHKKWIELGGAGVFRPEVVEPLLGKNIPVLAWGPGFDRIIMDFYNIKDIRELYKNDLKQLREIKAWLR